MPNLDHPAIMRTILIKPRATRSAVTGAAGLSSPWQWTAGSWTFSPPSDTDREDLEEEESVEDELA